jgi:predicted AAA+ superfamily ATPase
LLEVAIEAANISFPVGRVQYLYLRPFTFREFLGALQESNALEALSRIPVPAYAHSKLLRLFNIYSCVGGMPEAVCSYVESGGDLSSVNLVYSDLFAAFRDDIGKYGRNETLKRVLLHVFDSAPQFSGSRITFHGFGGSNYRSREVSEAFRSLERAMILDLVYPTTDFQEPLQPSRRKSPRLQFLDTGLVSQHAGLQRELLGAKDLSARHRGCLIEQLVGQEIKSTSLRVDTHLSFWVREKAQASAEVDFLIGTQRGIVPVEAKAGAAGKLRSLHQFMQRSKKRLAVRLYAGTAAKQNIELSNHSYTLLNVPYYAAGFLQEYVDAADREWKE